MAAVVDSAPIILLSGIGQFHLLRERFVEILITPQIEREVVREGQGRAGQSELQDALTAGWARLSPVPDQTLVARLWRPTLSPADTEVLASAVENGRATVVTDDASLRRACLEEQLPLAGTVGLLVRARLDGKIHALKPLLDQLIAEGFRLDPRGDVYRDALARVGE
jgi:predicted nucleic acid-binding protein